MEVGIRTRRALPYHQGQYAQVRFSGYRSRPFSITHPLRGNPNSRSVWFHVRRMKNGRVSSSLGTRIRPGHRVKLIGPHGSAHFRPDLDGRLLLVATNTGFAPIWSIAVAALRENPERRMMIIAGGRSIESLYMGPALVQLARFPNVVVVPVCSTPQTVTNAVKLGRPTDYLPRLLSTDVLYACGAPGMVDSVKSIAAHVGAVCYADPFLPTADDTVEESVLTRAMGWLAVSTSRQMGELAHRREQPMQAYRMAEARVEVIIVLRAHSLRSIGFGPSAPLRSSVLCLCGLLMIVGFAAGGTVASEPAKIVGPNACAECHKQETEAWKEHASFHDLSRNAAPEGSQ